MHQLFLKMSWAKTLMRERQQQSTATGARESFCRVQKAEDETVVKQTQESGTADAHTRVRGKQGVPVAIHNADKRSEARCCC